MAYRTLSFFSASSMFLGLLPAIASVKAESASTFTDSKSGIVFQRFSAQQSSFGIALPESVESSFIGQIAVPLTNGAGWGALGLNGAIDSNIFVAAYANGADVTGSLRNADQSEVTGDYSIRTIGESTSVDKSSLLYTFLCENCLSPGVGAALNGAGDTATLGFGLSSEVVSDPASTSATLGPANSGNGTFSISLAAARNAEFPTWAALATPEPSSTELKKRDIEERSPFDVEALPLLARSIVEESHRIDRRHKNGTRRKKNRTGAASRRNRSKAAKSKNGSAGAAAKAEAKERIAKAKAKAQQAIASITGKTQSAQSINLFGTLSTDKSSKVNKRHANGGRKKNRTGAARAKQAAAAANTNANTNAGTRANANTGGGHTHSAARSISLIDARHEVESESLPATARSVDDESKMAKRHAAGGGGRRRNRTGAARAKQAAAASSRGQSANTVAVREPMPEPHTQAGGGGRGGAAAAGTGAGAGAGTGARPQRGGGQGGNRVQRVRKFVEDFLRSRAVPEEELENNDDDDDFI
ncbi:Cellobiose dehydrogenase [Ceratocystis platani]|uniref:Cellobiose dehydrogenase n=1 Tax=Ceratocystis fimbriata f. sp. platani TaxID=88771 RepID=A0A0F8BX33_CERFI|nr:Cellobiose dehydrogenase [Ceratocystis platani]